MLSSVNAFDGGEGMVLTCGNDRKVCSSSSVSLLFVEMDESEGAPLLWRWVGMESFEEGMNAIAPSFVDAIR